MQISERNSETRNSDLTSDEWVLWRERLDRAEQSVASFQSDGNDGQSRG